MNTEAIWHLGERKIELRSVTIPEPGPGEVTVAMEACGICAWDVLAFNGRFGRYHPYPFSAGHEGVGRVIKTGDKVDTVAVGQRVALHELPLGTAGGPLMARHALRSQRQVTLIPESSLPVEHWVVEPVVCVVNGIVYSGVQPGDAVALVGAGYMGLLFVQGLSRYLLGSLAAFDVDDRRLALARRLGASRTVKVEGASVPPDMQRRFDVVIDTAGNADSMRTALSLLRPGGILENFAWHHHEYTFDLDDWTVSGIRILNIQPQMNPHFADLFPRAVTLMANGAFSNERLVTHTESVERAERIYSAAAEKAGGYMKGVVTF